MFRHRFGYAMMPGLLALLLAACGEATTGTSSAQLGSAALPSVEPAALGDGEALRVTATTSIVGDVVHQIGGDRIDLTVLMQPGQDPHSYEPAAADLTQMRNAHVVFMSGLGFETTLLDTLHNLGPEVPLVDVSVGVEVITAGPTTPEEALSSYLPVDPHVWQDPHQVMIWAENISLILSQRDPNNAEYYRANAVAYVAQLENLDATIKNQVERIPPENRKLVTNHDTFAYFARAYDFEVVGTVLVGASEVAEPAAGEIAALVETIRETGVPAIFVETTINDRLAQVVAEEVGREVKILRLYTDALGEPGSDAETYIGMMRTNVETLVEGLGE